LKGSSLCRPLREFCRIVLLGGKLDVALDLQPPLLELARATLAGVVQHLASDASQIELLAELLENMGRRS